MGLDQTSPGNVNPCHTSRREPASCAAPLSAPASAPEQPIACRPADRCCGFGGEISRRNAIALGATGGAGLLGALSLFDFFTKWRESEAPADTFKGDAPTGELWELWQKRGWVKEARHYLKLGRNVQCKVCPNNCILEPGDRSHCRNKVNRDGTLYTLVYGNPCTFHVDPVEKKPLYHFMPGTLSTLGNKYDDVF